MIVRSVTRVFIYSNLFVAYVLSLLTWASFETLSTLEMHWYVPASVFLGSFVLYTFHRLYKIDFIPEDQLSARHLWVVRRANAMKYAMSFAVFGLMLILPNFNADTIVWIIPAGIVSVGYTIPILPSQNGWRRFRDIPLTKPLIIALVVSYLTLAFPVFEQFAIHRIFEADMVQAFFERMLFILAVTLPFDLRDIQNDRDAGIDTLGTRMGFKTSKQIGGIVIVAWMFSVFMRFGLDVHAIMYLPYLILVLILSIAYYKMSEAWSDLHYVLCFEGAILLYAFVHWWAS